MTEFDQPGAAASDVPVPALTTAQQGGAAIATPVMADSDPALIKPSPQKDRSNRVKYRCPSCGAQAWGKPGLKLLCGEQSCKATPLEPPK